MTTGQAEPQIEQVRQLFLTAKMDQFRGLMELEVGSLRDRSLKPGRRIILNLFGPIGSDVSIRWLVSAGAHAVLSWSGEGRKVLGYGPWRFSISPGMTAQQVYDLIAESGLDPCQILHVGQIHAIELPGGCIRLLFALAEFRQPSLFWLWADDLTAELHRLGFRPAPSLDVPSQTAGVTGLGLPPMPEEPQPGDGFDLWFDWRAQCKALGYKVTLSHIAARTRYSLATVKKKHALYLADREP